MKFIYNDIIYGDIKLSVEKDIEIIYGSNSSGKTRICSNLYKSLISNSVTMVSPDTLNNFGIEYIPEMVELNKEISLKKTSILYKKLTIQINKFLEKENIDLVKSMNKEISDSKLLEYLDNKNFPNSYDENKYFLKMKSKIEMDSDILDNILSVSIYNKQDEKIVSEKDISISTLKKIYYELFLRPSDTIFILDCPETFLDNIEISNLISRVNEKLKYNCKFIIFTRSLNFYQRISKNNSYFYFADKINKEIKKYFITDQLIMKYISILNYDSNKYPNFDTYYNQAKEIIYDKEIEETRNTLMDNYLEKIISSIERSKLTLKIDENSLSTNDEFNLFYILFLKSNNLDLYKENKINFKNKELNYVNNLFFT